MIEGIDLDELLLVWEDWKDSAKFAIVKATEGPQAAFPEGWQNPEFPANWAAMRANGYQSRGCYHYAHPEYDPAKQAAYLVSYAREAGLEVGDFFALDLEVAGGLSPVQVSFWAWVFCREVNRLAPGHHCIVYTYPWFAEQGNCAMLGDRHLWIANYEVSSPEVPPPWDTWLIWQYAPGKYIDRDRYTGTLEELDKWTAAGQVR